MSSGWHQKAQRGDRWRVLVTKHNGHQWSRTFSCRNFSIGADHYAGVVRSHTGWNVEIKAIEEER